MYPAYKLNKQDDNMQPWCTPFLTWNQSVVPCPFNCCFLTCIQISQEAVKVVWYAHLLKNFPQFVVMQMRACVLSQFSRVRLFVTLWSVAQQAPLSKGLSRQEYWSGLPFPSPVHESEVARSCPTLYDPMDCSLPGSSVHGIFQARVLEWVAIAFSNSLDVLHFLFGTSLLFHVQF